MNHPIFKAPKSQAIWRRGIKSVGSSRSDLDGLFPISFARGKGAVVWDYDGNRYLDFTSATGSILLGYAVRDVDRSAQEAARRGGCLPAQLTDLQVELAERLIGLLPAAERVQFFRTGSEACSAAVRLCRTFTGHRTVLTSGYHGWHDWQLAMYAAGASMDKSAINFGYNLNVLERELRRNKHVACVIVTPEPNFFPCSYWRELRGLTQRHGVLLVFDEVMTGFRYGMSGFHGFVRVRPDVVVFSKGLANGYALAAVTGRRDVLMARETTHLWSTYAGEMGPLAAAITTIDLCARKGVPRHLQKIGELFISGIRELIAGHGLQAEVIRQPPVFHVVFEHDELWNDLVDDCLLRGLILSPRDSQVMMAAHTAAHIRSALRIMNEGLVRQRSRYPSAFGKRASRLSPKALLRRTHAEFGGRSDFRAPPRFAIQEVVPLSLPRIGALRGTSGGP